MEGVMCIFDGSKQVGDRVGRGRREGGREGGRKRKWMGTYI
jgi:hypothetical protein